MGASLLRGVALLLGHLSCAPNAAHVQFPDLAMHLTLHTTCSLILRLCIAIHASSPAAGSCCSHRQPTVHAPSAAPKPSRSHFTTAQVPPRASLPDTHRTQNRTCGGMRRARLRGCAPWCQMRAPARSWCTSTAPCPWTPACMLWASSPQSAPCSSPHWRPCASCCGLLRPWVSIAAAAVAALSLYQVPRKHLLALRAVHVMHMAAERRSHQLSAAVGRHRSFGRLCFRCIEHR